MAILEHSDASQDNAEPGPTLADPPPRTLGLLDQVALWGNLGVSLLGPAWKQRGHVLGLADRLTDQPPSPQREPSCH